MVGIEPTLLNLKRVFEFKFAACTFLKVTSNISTWAFIKNIDVGRIRTCDSYEKRPTNKIAA